MSPANDNTRWSLGAKMALVGGPLLLLTLLPIVVTLWMSFKLDAGTAAVNEARRMRMQAYRMALSVAQSNPTSLATQIQEFESSLALLRLGNPVRPLSVPWDDTVSQQFEALEQQWADYRARWASLSVTDQSGLTAATHTMVNALEDFVRGVEQRLLEWTTLLHLMQTAVLVLAVIWALGLLVAAYKLVLEPIRELHRAMRAFQNGDWNVRMERGDTLEFDDLGLGFNAMAAHLQHLYEDLEHKVQAKTAELQDKHERLEQLYEVTALLSRSSSLEQLAQEFATAVQRIARADAVALRWSDQAHERYHILASAGLPPAMVESENCLEVGVCYCGRTPDNTGMVVIPLHQLPQRSLRHCEKAGFASIYSVPILLQERLLGEVNLFFRQPVAEPSAGERHLLEALGRQLATAMENLRLGALEREEAVSGERTHLARELHDSIAQSLAFLKIQVGLMRAAMDSQDPAQARATLDEIDAGVRECYGDVRELLVHFRTRTNTEDIVPALQTTLRKFEHQTGIKARLEVHSLGVGLPADVQIQVLHVLQEALSNVRKHARASQVVLTVQGQPQWRFEVHDNGVGFDAQAPRTETHVGLGIMAERAQRIGASLQIVSTRQQGTGVTLLLSRA
ncbi:MAG: histidine kinase [Rhodoferax sp.]